MCGLDMPLRMGYVKNLGGSWCEVLGSAGAEKLRGDLHTNPWQRLVQYCHLEKKILLYHANFGGHWKNAMKVKMQHLENIERYILRGNKSVLLGSGKYRLVLIKKTYDLSRCLKRRTKK
jgi:hypothetical protein